MMAHVRSCARNLLLSGMLLFVGSSSEVFGQVLYISNNFQRTISTYIFDLDSGFLTEVLPRVAVPGNPSGVTIHPSGKFLYTANTGSPSVTVYSIDPLTGVVRQSSNTTFATGTTPQAVAIDPSGKFAFVAHPGIPSISSFSVNQETGALTAVPGSPFETPANPNSVMVHPSGKFVYVTAQGASQIVAFSIGANGALSPVAGSPFAARNGLQWMAIDPAGKTLYATERQDSAVLAYSIDASTGALTPVAGSPFFAAAGVAGVAVDPSGKYLYTANGGTVSAFRIAAAGALTRIANIAGPGTTNGVIVDPSGKFVYVPGPQSANVSAYSIHPETGALNFAFTVPAGAGPQRGAAVIFSPPILPPMHLTSAVNGASRSPAGMPNAAIAQGSNLVLTGRNIGPFSGEESDFPLTTKLNGVSVQIQSGDVKTDALMLDVDHESVECLVPSGTPLGDATVTLTYKGRTAGPVPITVVPASPGVFTRSSSGQGPAEAWNVPPDLPIKLDESLVQIRNTIDNSAKPGQTIVVRATGLGAVSADETQQFIQELDVPAEVIAGSKQATVIAKARSVWGGDYLVIKLPDNVEQGCYVPVAVRAGGLTSNVASISIAADGGSCSTEVGLSSADIDTARNSGQLRMGKIGVAHFEIPQFGVFDTAASRFIGQDLRSLRVISSPAAIEAGILDIFAVPPAGACTVTPGFVANPGDPLQFDSPGGTGQNLNPGPALNLSTPANSLRLPAPSYSADIDSPGVTPGDYTVDNGTGGPDIRAFKAGLAVPPMIKWTNQGETATPDRSQELTLTWTGGVPDKQLVGVVGLSWNRQAVALFMCTEKVSAGKFTVPSWVLSSLPATAPSDGLPSPGGLLGLVTFPLSNVSRFDAPGLHFASFLYEQAILVPATFK